jgi:hypothetical protein
MQIALETATKLICAALAFALMLTPALVPAAMMWGMSEHWRAHAGYALTTVIAASAEQLPDKLRVGGVLPWGMVAYGAPDLSDDFDEP